MYLSEGVEWGIHCLAVLGSLPQGASMSGRALAEFHGVSPTYLLKHLKTLTAAGLVESVPGRRGGFRLAKSPQDISLLDTVVAIDGTSAAFRCTEIRQRAPVPKPPAAFNRPCPVKVAMLKADAAWRSALAAQTIADIIATVERIAHPEVARRYTEWLAEQVR
jgi:Rrf2 family protein